MNTSSQFEKDPPQFEAVALIEAERRLEPDLVREEPENGETDKAFPLAEARRLAHAILRLEGLTGAEGDDRPVGGGGLGPGEGQDGLGGHDDLIDGVARKRAGNPRAGDCHREGLIAPRGRVDEHHLDGAVGVAHHVGGDALPRRVRGLRARDREGLHVVGATFGSDRAVDLGSFSSFFPGIR